MSSKQLCGKSLDFHENKDGSFQPNLNFETIAETVLLLFYVSFEEYQNIYYTVSFIEVTLRNHKQQKKKSQQTLIIVMKVQLRNTAILKLYAISMYKVQYLTVDELE